MRFTGIIVAGTFALLANAQNTGSGVATADPAQASSLACLDRCEAGDVTCQAKCIAVPNPNESQVNATTACVASCDQGDGSEAQTNRYSQCVQKCINDNYFTSGGTPAQTVGSSGTHTGSSATPTSTGDNSSGGDDNDDSSNSGSSTSGSSPTRTGTSSSGSASASGSSADSVRAGVAGLSLLGFIAAAVAL